METLIVHLSSLPRISHSRTLSLGFLAQDQRFVQFLTEFQMTMLKNLLIFPRRSHPPPAFGSSPNLEALALEGNKQHDDEEDYDADASSKLLRPMHEITFSTDDKPKLLSQTSLLAEIGMNIQEAHAFSTLDGYSLDVFVVDGWP